MEKYFNGPAFDLEPALVDGSNADDDNDADDVDDNNDNDADHVDVDDNNANDVDDHGNKGAVSFYFPFYGLQL